jgi:adhesin HecA-like repeat protein
LGNGVFALILIGLIGINVNILYGFYIPWLNDTQDTTKTQEKTQGGLIYAKNQLQITSANHLLNDKSSIVAEGDIVINDTKF